MWCTVRVGSHTVYSIHFDVIGFVFVVVSVFVIVVFVFVVFVFIFVFVLVFVVCLSARGGRTWRWAGGARGRRIGVLGVFGRIRI